jgi:ribulose-5-phosphate 4-epimerase/fuculose-1-phosphate aldolase
VSEEARLREAICRIGRSLFERGLTFGSSGNLSVRLPEGGFLATPTNVALGDLDPTRLARLDEAGRPLGGDPPTKEVPMHLGMYRARPSAAAVVHLHSTWSVAVSLLDGLDPEEPIPPLTAYYVMRVGRLKLLPYIPPGDPALGSAVEAVADRHHAVLLANHGPVVAGSSLEAAVHAIEELEETAKLFVHLQGRPIRPLTAEQVAELRRRFPG